MANKATVSRGWQIVDVEGKTLGRVCSRIAHVLRGKHKPSYTPHVDCGDNVIVINASKVILTGSKDTNKEYITFSGYPGGQKRIPADVMRNRHPERMIEHAVKGMLPKNRLGAEMYRKLHVFPGGEHPHQAQQPTTLKV